jgi:hypothetical protein
MNQLNENGNPFACVMFIVSGSRIKRYFDRRRENEIRITKKVKSGGKIRKGFGCKRGGGSCVAGQKVVKGNVPELE